MKMKNDSTMPGVPELVKQKVLHIAEGAQIILFGSQARGDSRPDSDWDFLILLDKPATIAQKEAIRAGLYRVELASGAVISSIIHKKSDWEERRITSIYQIIEHEGIVL